MGRIDGIISDELEAKFRVKVVTDLGGKKGTLSEALEEAIDAWIKNNKGSSKK